jgi:hypothetical protein
LAGTIVQVLNYRTELIKKLKDLIEDTDYHLTAFNPKCIVIIGNANEELNDVQSRKSFEIFRNSLKDVEIITYDELFRKVEILAELFGLKRKTGN